MDTDPKSMVPSDAGLMFTGLKASSDADQLSVASSDAGLIFVAPSYTGPKVTSGDCLRATPKASLMLSSEADPKTVVKPVATSKSRPVPGASSLTIVSPKATQTTIVSLQLKPMTVANLGTIPKTVAAEAGTANTTADEPTNSQVLLPEWFLWFLCLMVYQLFLDYLMPKPFS